MIIEYNSQYDQEIKNLFVELQTYIASIDQEKYNLVPEEYGTQYLLKTKKEIEENRGEMLLYQKDSKIVGLVVGIINNEPIQEFDFQAPKRGKITELIVSSKFRFQGYGGLLLHAMENFLKECGCCDILLDVFGYNEKAIRFYERNGYHSRMIEMTKKCDID